MSVTGTFAAHAPNSPPSFNKSAQRCADVSRLRCGFVSVASNAFPKQRPT
jgi:hypothetical protein